jgi:hypothetical protein
MLRRCKVKDEITSRQVAMAVSKVLHDPENSKKARVAAGLYLSQPRYCYPTFSAAKTAAYRILRDPARSKASTIAAGLDLTSRPKR